MSAPNQPRFSGVTGLIAGGLMLFSSPALAAEHPVASAREIAALNVRLVPGDSLVLADGDWTNQVIRFQARGTATQPITLRPQTAGKVVLTGNSSVTVDGEFLVVTGLWLDQAQASSDGFKLAGRNNRLTECAIVGGRHKFFVHLYGVSNRVDHCYLAGKTNDSPTLQVEVGSEPNRHQIDHNHFGPRPPLGHNGSETIRVGYSHQSLSNSASVVELNLFDRCDGELEIISNKSCANVYRGNTFLECAGTLTLRHGNRCVVEGNFFLGHHQRGTGGIRVIGEDHRIVNNYLDGLETGSLWLTTGITEPKLAEYFQVRNCLIAFNTFVDSRGPVLQLDAGYLTPRRVLRPEQVTIANNLFAVRDGGALMTGTEGGSFQWRGNLANVAPADAPGIRVVDLKLARARDGLWRPTPGSPVLGAAEGEFPQVKRDLDGQPRTGKLDIGSDQVSDAPITSRPLSAADVGPGWMDRNDGIPSK